MNLERLPNALTSIGVPADFFDDTKDNYSLRIVKKKISDLLVTDECKGLARLYVSDLANKIETNKYVLNMLFLDENQKYNDLLITYILFSFKHIKENSHSHFLYF